MRGREDGRMGGAASHLWQLARDDKREGDLCSRKEEGEGEAWRQMEGD